jgi:D-glycero-alpha-D-manno-heptose 1-phosphate guanylyltransferase
MQAIILAGGLGTRLRGVIGDLPKPMALVGGHPFLHHLLTALSAAGFRSVVLSVGHRHEVIVEYFGAAFAGLSIEYSVESIPLGTGGAIRQSLGRARPGPCFVLNGDTMVEVDYAAMFNAHTTRGARLTMAACRLDEVGRFGALAIDDGVVTAFLEKGAVGAGYINAGVYLTDASLFDGYALPERFSFETDFLARHLATIRPRAFETQGRFLDIGIPQDYQRAEAFFEKMDPRPR